MIGADANVGRPSRVLRHGLHARQRREPRDRVATAYLGRIVALRPSFLRLPRLQHEHITWIVRNVFPARGLAPKGESSQRTRAGVAEGTSQMGPQPAPYPRAVVQPLDSRAARVPAVSRSRARHRFT